MKPIRVAITGLGAWGPNLLRNAVSIGGMEVVLLCDANPAALKPFKRLYPLIRQTTSYDEVLGASDVDAMILATPASLHFEQARAALDAQKSVLVEKPFVFQVSQVEELIALAEKNHCTLMAGHTFLYNAAVRWIKRYIESGELGEVRYITSLRLSLGRIRRDVNALWNLAPHDVSILIYLFDSLPESVTAIGRKFLQEKLEDVVFTTLEFASGQLAHIQVSWLNPLKRREMLIVGSRKMLVYNDVSTEAKIVIYDSGVDRKAIEPEDATGSFGDFQLKVRTGDVHIPKINFIEPLRVELEHFCECVREKKEPLTGARHILDVTRVLEAAQRSLDSAGKRIQI